MPQVLSLDHLVLTVSDLDRTKQFYQQVLGMRVSEFSPADGSRRVALKFGSQKINLHEAAAPFLPNAQNATSGSADLCFLSETPLETWISHFEMLSVQVEEGPVERTGAMGPILSLYIRDPDGNLIEVSNQEAR